MAFIRTGFGASYIYYNKEFKHKVALVPTLTIHLEKCAGGPKISFTPGWASGEKLRLSCLS